MESEQAERSGANETDPWAFFWASMLAAIIQSTDEELAEAAGVLATAETARL